LAVRPAAAETQSEPLQRIYVLVDSADFDGAEKEGARALDSGALERPTLARVYLELGVVACARRDLAAGEALFRKALALDGDLALRDSAGPHITDVFVRARAAVAAKPSMKIQANLTRGSATEVVVTAKVTDDSEGLARAVVVEADGVRALRPLDPSGTSFAQRIEGAAERCVTVSAGIVDERGNSVWPNAVRETFCPKPTPAVAAGAVPAANQPPPERPLDAPSEPTGRPTPTHVWIGVGLTGALAIATTVLGIVALNERADYHEKNSDETVSIPERTDARDKAEDAARRATIAGIATGVVGSATVVLYLTRPTSETPVTAALSARQITLAARF
jgi:hypothetical protein